MMCKKILISFIVILYVLPLCVVSSGSALPEFIDGDEAFWEWIDNNPYGGNIILGADITINRNIYLFGELNINTGEYGVTLDGGSVSIDTPFTLVGEGVNTPVMTLISTGAGRFDQEWNFALSHYNIKADGKNGAGGTALHIKAADATEQPMLEYCGKISAEGENAVGVRFEYPVEAYFLDISVNGKNSTTAEAPDETVLLYSRLEAGGEGAVLASVGNILFDTCAVNGDAGSAYVLNRKIIALAGNWLYMPLTADRELWECPQYRSFTNISLINFLLSGDENHPSEIRRIYCEWDRDMINAVDTSQIGETVIPGYLYDIYRDLGLEDDFCLDLIIEVFQAGGIYITDVMFDDFSGPNVYLTVNYDEFDPRDGGFILWRSDDGGESWYDITGSPDVFNTDGIGIKYFYGEIAEPVLLSLQDTQSGGVSSIIKIFGYEGKVYYSTGGDRTGVGRVGMTAVPPPFDAVDSESSDVEEPESSEPVEQIELSEIAEIAEIPDIAEPSPVPNIPKIEPLFELTPTPVTKSTPVPEQPPAPDNQDVQYKPVKPQQSPSGDENNGKDYSLTNNGENADGSFFGAGENALGYASSAEDISSLSENGENINGEDLFSRLSDSYVWKNENNPADDSSADDLNSEILNTRRTEDSVSASSYVTNAGKKQSDDFPIAGMILALTGIVGICAFITAAKRRGTSRPVIEPAYKTKQIITAACICVLTVSSCLVLYRYDNKYTASGPRGENGVLILNEQDVKRNTFLIEGWEVYGGKLLTPEDFIHDSKPEPDEHVFIGQYAGFEKIIGSPHGSVTYRLVVIIPEEMCNYTLALPEIYSSCRVFINGTEYLSLGETDPDTYRFETKNTSVTFNAAEKIDIIIAVSDFSHLYSGMVYPPAIGETETVFAMLNMRLILRSVVISAALLIGIMSLFIGLSRGRKGLPVLYGLLCLLFAGYTCYPVTMTVAQGSVLMYAVENVSFCAMLLVIIIMQDKIYSYSGAAKRIKPFAIGFGAFVCLAAFVMPFIMPKAGLPFMIVYSRLIEAYEFTAAGYITIMSGLAVRRKSSESVPVLWGMLILDCALIMDNARPSFEPIFTGWFPEAGSFLLIISLGAATAREIISAYRESAVMEERVNTIISSRHDYYRKMDEMHGKLRILHHDYKFHLNTVRRMLHSGDSNGADNYLTGVENRLSEYEIPKFCKSPVINALVENYSEHCAEKNIVFETKLTIPDTLGIPDYDMCVILGNLLENAVEACEKLDVNGAGSNALKRVIKLETQNTSAQLLIMVKNSFDGLIREENGIQSTKKEGGLGLRSVREIISRHGGELITEWDGEYFTVYAAVQTRGKKKLKSAKTV